MESRTKFNLKESIEIWKLELYQNSNMTKDNINELESHLQDEIHELQKLGLSIEESMLIAKNRIGNIEELKTEFGKVNKELFFKNRITPYLKGILLYFAFIAITQLLMNSSLIIGAKIGMESKNLNYISIGLLIFLTSIVLILFYKKYKNMSLNLHKLTSIPILVSVILFSKLVTFFSTLFITRSLGIVSDYGHLVMNLSVYNQMFGLFILIISCIIFYSSKRENTVEIAE